MRFIVALLFLFASGAWGWRSSRPTGMRTVAPSVAPDRHTGQHHLSN